MAKNYKFGLKKAKLATLPLSRTKQHTSNMAAAYYFHLAETKFTIK